MREYVFIFLLLIAGSAFGQKPKNGTYTYHIAWAEWNGKTLGATCTVVIKNDSVKIVNNGSVSGKKGDILIEGIIMQHKKTGKWIIGHTKNDIYAKEIGGCSNGPTIIDFKHRTWESC